MAGNYMYKPGKGVQGHHAFLHCFASGLTVGRAVLIQLNRTRFWGKTEHRAQVAAVQISDESFSSRGRKPWDALGHHSAMGAQNLARQNCVWGLGRHLSDRMFCLGLVPTGTSKRNGEDIFTSSMHHLYKEKKQNSSVMLWQHAEGSAVLWVQALILHSPCVC